MRVVREDQRGPAVCLGRPDREQVLGHQRVPDPGQAGEAFLLGQWCGGRGVVTQQRDRGRGVYERRRPALWPPRCPQVQLGQQVVGEHPQSLGVGRAPDRSARFPDRGRVTPPRLVPDQVVDLGGPVQVEEVADLVEVAARARGALQLHRGVEAVERQALGDRPSGVPLPHPQQQVAVGRGRSEPVAEPFGERPVERHGGDALHELVGDQPGRPVALQRRSTGSRARPAT